MQPVPAEVMAWLIVIVGHVAGREHALDAGVRAERLGPA